MLFLLLFYFYSLLIYSVLNHLVFLPSSGQCQHS
jgi:hypothetical protein